MKKILSLLLLTSLYLTGCGEADNKQDTNNDEQVINSYTTAALEKQIDEVELQEPSLNLIGDTSFSSEGTLRFTVNVEGLITQAPVYMTINSDAITANTISVTPIKSIIYPTSGKLSIQVDVKNKNLEKNTTLMIKISVSNHILLQSTYLIDTTMQEKR